MNTAPKSSGPELPKSNETFSSQSSNSVEDLARIFNTALISSRGEEPRDFTAELCGLMQGSAFKAIMGAIKTLAREESLSEKDAAERLIQTFRKVDRIWLDYIFQEGIDRLKNQSRH